MLAPLTNLQSHKDGTLSDEEFHWLTMRAKGGFGLTMTCASHVQAQGLGFPGQLGIFGDEHLPGLTRLAAAIRQEHSVAVVQLHHAGMRSPGAMIGTQPVCPSDNEETGARGLSLGEVEQLAEDFIAAAIRAEKAGFDGVELHGAHGYVLCQFLSSEINKRSDRFGGGLEGRSRIIFDIIDGIRARCGEDFAVAVRLSPERFGMKTQEIVEVFGRLVDTGKVDMIDMSLWDCFKEAAEEDFSGQRLIDIFANLERGNTRLAVAGKLYSTADAQRAIDAGADMVAIGRAAVTNHDFPTQSHDPNFAMRTLPVAREILRAEGLSDAFIGYMGNWPGFVAD
jgi:2,4-dienoyl-CoA reductase-like NADH-dependent reductase (Old Yellow Enzyme family)